MNNHDIKFEWGHNGIASLGPSSDAMVLVDVLSFTTCVDIAVSRGATVYPYAWNDESASDYAASHDALLALGRGSAVSKNTYTLSPESLTVIPADTRLVLPSPNGSSLTLLASEYCSVFAACLRNYRAVAAYVQDRYKRISIIACGERWPGDELRPAIEDLLGAGAVVAELTGAKSIEALFVENCYVSQKDRIQELVKGCVSGQELCERGFEVDILHATELNISQSVPECIDQIYVDQRVSKDNTR